MRTDTEIEEYSRRIREVIMQKCYAEHDSHSDCGCVQKINRSVDLYTACIPESFWNLNPKKIFKGEDFEKSIIKYISNIKTALKTGYGMFFLGVSGSGKTFWSNFVLVSAVRRGYSAYYTTMANLEQNVKRSESYSEKEIKERLKWYFTSDFVVIDEIGVESAPSKIEKKTLFYKYFKSLINQRDESKMPVILTTKSTGQDIQDLYDETTLSIILNKYQWVLLPDIDHRQKEKKRMEKLMGFARG